MATNIVTDAVVLARNLCKGFVEGDETRSVLTGLDAEIMAGEMIALIGRSGSGKSTLLNLIGGIDTADEGELWVCGENLVTMSEYQRTLYRRRRVGFVFQFFNLIPTLTVLENVSLPMELNGMTDAKARNQVLQCLTDVGLAERANSFPDRLSGGEQQRVAVARAIAHQPDIVLADEPTGNLDLETGHEVIALLKRLTLENKHTLILATHNSEASAAAHRIVEIRNGKLV